MRVTNLVDSNRDKAETPEASNITEIFLAVQIFFT